MKLAYSVLATSVIMLTASICTATAQMPDAHTVVTPQNIKWGPAPDSLPAGAQIAVLYGDPSKDALFAFRLKIPKGYRIPPHTHPKPEIVTVISGAFRIGMGDSGDQNKADRL